MPPMMLVVLVFLLLLFYCRHRVLGRPPFPVTALVLLVVWMPMLHTMATRHLLWQIWLLTPVAGQCSIGLLRAYLKPKNATVPTDSTFFRFPWAAFTLGSLVIMISAFLVWALPVPVLPATDPLGTFTTVIDQPDRPEFYAADPNATRRFPVQVWYPAVPETTGTPEPWVPSLKQVAPILSKQVKLPPFLLGHLQYVTSHAHENAVPAATTDAGFPVVIYSHGWTGFRSVALTEIEALANDGYVVIAPDHTYGALFTMLDGQVVPHNPRAMPPSDPEDAHQAGIERLVDTYAGDLRRCIDLAADIQSGALPSPLEGRLDLSRIGLFGHSTGGGAAVEVGKTDPRVKAVFAFDPWVEPVSPDVRVIIRDIPFASIRSGQWQKRDGANNAILSKLLPTFGENTYDLYIPNTKHTDFTLMPMLSPLMPKIGATGPLDAKRSLATADGALTAFFDAFLKGESKPAIFEDAIDGQYLVPGNADSDKGRIEATAWQTTAADSLSPS